MIRKLKNEEINKVMDIWKESTIKAHNFIDKEYWENNYDDVKNIYIPISDTFVYDNGENIKGFISIINNEFIGALFVDVNYQGLGIGSKLIDYVIKKYEKLNLAVYKENEKAVKFYANKGFKIIKEQKNEDSGFKEYIMKKLYLE
ncbi:N-acetyltransferase [Tepidibacter hydrothermalis]|uniref:N-acetyltransferase n=1 Tax=Tepidibacter hydrothermalis TaxID=3036126 RepID=A0ABY8EFY8_9FIRM|nr:N-acetyltransferase [Tepidibacter hydrothermalis]WFD11874.1 N-acetyltransferase [Tepidibacter hydrothermalis]